MADGDGMKGLVEQIRTVHLALLLAAFVLLATALQAPQRKIERSISDARDIYAVSNRLKPWAEPIGLEVNKAAAKFLESTGDEMQKGKQVNLEITWPDNKKQIVGLYGPLAVAYLSDAPHKDEDEVRNPAYQDIPFRVRSLADFIRFWNHNLEDQFVVVPRIEAKNVEKIVLYHPMESINAKSFRLLPHDLTPTPKLLMPLHAEVENNLLKFYTHPEKGEPGVTIAVPIIKIPSLNIQTLLRKYANKETEWLPGPFATAFPELNERAKNLKTLDLEDLVKELNDQANREQDKIELLGAKLDPVLLTRWGLWIVAVCQFYLWLHLNALLKSVSPALEESSLLGWIGLYSGFSARIFTLLSLLLPAGIAVFWLIQQWGVLGSRWRLLAGLNAMICLLLGLTTVRTLYFLWKRTLRPAGYVALCAEHITFCSSQEYYCSS